MCPLCVGFALALDGALGGRSNGDAKVVDVKVEHIGYVVVTQGDVYGLTGIVVKADIEVTPIGGGVAFPYRCRCGGAGYCGLGADVYCIVLGSIVGVLTLVPPSEC